jgi:hypothetical protein
MTAPNPDLWAKHRGQTLAQVLTRMASRQAVRREPPPPPPRPQQGGSELKGSMTLPPGTPLVRGA